MAISTVLLVTGPAGAGKTSVARAWATTRQYTAAHISLDDIRDYVRAGYADPQQGWNAECQRQYELARRGCAMLARQYAEAGIACAIDDVIFPAWDAVSLAGWQQDLRDIPHHLVVLLPRWERVLERNRQRAGRHQLTDDMLQTIYQMMEPWQTREEIIIDNSELSIRETVTAIDQTLAVSKCG